MKKLLLVLAIGAFVACNDSTEVEGSTTDSIPATLAPVDSTVAAPVDSAVIAVDSTANAVDSLKK